MKRVDYINLILINKTKITNSVFKNNLLLIAFLLYSMSFK